MQRFKSYNEIDEINFEEEEENEEVNKAWVISFTISFEWILID